MTTRANDVAATAAIAGGLTLIAWRIVATARGLLR